MDGKLTNRSTGKSEDIRNLSARGFLNFGIQQVAYIRPVKIENKTAYAIHAADGTPLSVMDSMDTAVITVRHNDLEPATVH